MPRDRDIQRVARVDQRRIVHALDALPARQDDRQVAPGIGAEAQRRARGQVQLDIAPEPNGPRGKDAVGNQHAAAAARGAVLQRAVDRQSGVLLPPRHGPVLHDVAFERREDRRTNAFQDAGHRIPAGSARG